MFNEVLSHCADVYLLPITRVEPTIATGGIGQAIEKVRRRTPPHMLETRINMVGGNGWKG